MTFVMARAERNDTGWD